MDLFYALADPTRREIVESLSRGERSFGELAAQFEMSRPAVSQHLKVLRETGLVTSRADAQRRIYRLDAAGLAELDDWLGKVRSFWSAHLDKLTQAMNAPADKETENE